MAERRVSFEINLEMDRALRDLSTFESRINRLASGSLGQGGSASSTGSPIGSNLTRELDALERKSLSLNRALTNLGTGSRTFAPVAAEARELAAEATRTENRIRSLTAELTRTSDKTVIDELIRDASRAKSELAGLERQSRGLQSLNLTARRDGLIPATPSAAAGAGSPLIAGAIAGGAAGLAASALTQIPGVALDAGRALFDLTKSASDYGSSIFDAQAKTGLSVETLQGLRLAATTSGSSFEAVSGSISRFSKLVGAANAGNEAATASLAKFGLTPQAALRDLDGSLGKVFQTISELPPGVAQMTAAQTAFGRGGAELLPTIKSFDGNLSGLKTRAQELGLVLSADALKAADDFGDTFDVVSLQASAAAAKIALEFAPVITSGLNDVSKFLSDNSANFATWGQSVGDTIAGVRQQFTSDRLTAVGEAISLAFRSSPIGYLYNQFESAGREERLAQPPPSLTKSQLSQITTDFGNSVDSRSARSSAAARRFLDNPIEKAKKELDAQKKAADAAKKLNDESEKLVGTFTSLLTQSQSENPFVRVFNDGDAALQRLKNELKGLSPEIAKQFTDLQQTINFNRTFACLKSQRRNHRILQL